MNRERAKVAGIAAGIAAAIAAWLSARVALRWARAAAYAARFGLRVITLTAYRRCPTCFRVLRREAVVCRSCGARVRR